MLNHIQAAKLFGIFVSIFRTGVQHIKTVLYWLLTQHFGKVCIMKIRIFIRKFLPLRLCPNHKRVHGSLNPSLFLGPIPNTSPTSIPTMASTSSPRCGIRRSAPRGSVTVCHLVEKGTSPAEAKIVLVLLKELLVLYGGVYGGQLVAEGEVLGRPLEGRVAHGADPRVLHQGGGGGRKTVHGRRVVEVVEGGGHDGTGNHFWRNRRVCEAR